MKCNWLDLRCDERLRHKAYALLLPPVNVAVARCRKWVATRFVDCGSRLTVTHRITHPRSRALRRHAPVAAELDHRHGPFAQIGALGPSGQEVLPQGRHPRGLDWRQGRRAAVRGLQGLLPARTESRWRVATRHYTCGIVRIPSCWLTACFSGCSRFSPYRFVRWLDGGCFVMRLRCDVTHGDCVFLTRVWWRSTKRSKATWPLIKTEWSRLPPLRRNSSNERKFRLNSRSCFGLKMMRQSTLKARFWV